VVDGSRAGNALLAVLVERVEASALLTSGFPGGLAGRRELERLLEEGATLLGVRGVRVDAVEALKRELLGNLRVVGGERLVARLDDREAVLEPFGIGEIVSTTARPCSSPSGSEKIREPSARSVSTPSAPSRCSQKSSASGEATRHSTRWTMPAPARPGRAPGYSKNVMSLPGAPSSSP